MINFAGNFWRLGMLFLEYVVQYKDEFSNSEM